MTEMWSFVQSKQQPRWLWQAVDHTTGEVLAYVPNTREDRAFLELKALLQPFGIQHFYTDGWRAYERHLNVKQATYRNGTKKSSKLYGIRATDFKVIEE